MATYDPQKVTITFRGVRITGFVKGTFINVSTPDQTKTEVGAQGDYVAVHLADRSGTVEVTLLQTSLSNDALSSIANLDRRAPGSGHGPLMIKDGNGATLLSTDDAWIQKLADFGASDDLTPRAHTIAFGKADPFIGGNAL